MPNNHIDYIELPATSTAAMKDFYGQVFGWTFLEWGSSYATFNGAGVEGGFNTEPDHRTAAPLVIIRTDAIEAMETSVTAAGGRITAHIFQYPGGRRFHFTDPHGNELAVMQPD